jgi:hypothetical protein
MGDPFSPCMTLSPSLDMSLLLQEQIMSLPVELPLMMPQPPPPPPSVISSASPASSGSSAVSSPAPRITKKRKPRAPGCEFVRESRKRSACFIKRSAGLIKKARELEIMTGCKLLLLIESPGARAGNHQFTGHASRAMRGFYERPEGVALINRCMSAPTLPPAYCSLYDEAKSAWVFLPGYPPGASAEQSPPSSESLPDDVTLLHVPYN